MHHSRGEPLRPPAPIQKCRKKRRSVSLGFQRSRKKRRFVSSGLQKSRKKRRSMSSAATRAALEFSENSGQQKKTAPVEKFNLKTDDFLALAGGTPGRPF